MLAKEIITKQYDYNNWANGRIFDKAALVSAEELYAPSVVEGRSLHEILYHLARVEKVWRLQCQFGRVDPAGFPPAETLTTVEALQSFLAEEARAMRDYLTGLDEKALAEVVLVKRWDGLQAELIRWHMLAHMLLHSMQHRSEAAVLLTQYGHSPGDIDFLFFLD